MIGGQLCGRDAVPTGGLSGTSALGILVPHRTASSGPPADSAVWTSNESVRLLGIHSNDALAAFLALQSPCLPAGVIRSAQRMWPLSCHVGSCMSQLAGSSHLPRCWKLPHTCEALSCLHRLRTLAGILRTVAHDSYVHRRSSVG